MLPRFLRSITAVALALSAQASIAGSPSAANAAPANHKNCAAKSHQHGQVAATKPVKPVQRSGGGAGAQMRRSPDVQILSFGP
jgi:hypothetical protein